VNIAEVIGWKFKHQSGMSCKEIDGVMTIVDFPGGIPSKTDQNLWTIQYNDYTAAGGEVNKKAQDLLSNKLILSLIEELALLPNGANLLSKVKERLKSKL